MSADNLDMDGDQGLADASESRTSANEDVGDLRRNLHSLGMAMRELLEVRPIAALESGEISPDQLRVLRLVSFNRGMRVGQVADGLGIKPSSASLILDRLEARGYLRRMVDSRDRRIIRLEPTQRGELVFEEADAASKAKLESATEEFSADQVAQLNSLIGRLIRGLMKGEKIFASLCFHCGSQVSGNCVLDMEYDHCPYRKRILPNES